MHTQRISTTHSRFLKEIALVCTGLTIVLLILWGINSQIIEPAFQSLEQQQARDNAERVIAGIESQLSNLTSITNDWASWDDTYEFAKDHNRKYIESNNPAPALLSETSNVDLLIIYDKQGVELSYNNFHPEIGKSVIIQSFSGKTPAILALITPVLDHEIPMTGILQTNHGLLLLAVRPIYNSQAHGPSRGALLMGRFLSPSVLLAIAKTVNVPFSLVSQTEGQLTPTEHSLLNRFATAASGSKPEVHNGFLYTIYPDIEKQPTLLLRLPLRFEITSLGRRTSIILSSTLSIIAICLLICLVAYRSRMMTSEHALKQEQFFSKSIIESLPGIFCLYTYPELRLVLWNKTHESLLQREAGEMQGCHLTEWFAPEDKDTIVGAIKKGLETGHLRIETSLRAKNGNLIPFIINCVKLETQNQLYLMGVGIDISERIQMEEALLKSEDKYRTILENMEDGYFEVSLNGSVTFCNGAMSKIWGYSNSELVGMNYRQFTDSVNAEKIFQAFNRVYRTGEPTKEFDWQIIGSDGTNRYIDVSTSLLKDSTEEPRGFKGIICDITEQKHAELEKAKLENQLQQAQKMESVGQLAGGVAHDFNNMLSVILGYVEIALDEVESSRPLYVYLTEIRKAAERSADITRQLLAFARKQTVAPKVLDLNNTVEGMLKMLRRLIGEDIHLAWLPGPNLWPVKVDPSQIDQMLANLCINARDAIDGVGEIKVETGNSILEEEFCTAHPGFVIGEYVRIAVSDDGVGMDKETLEHIFEPFFTTKGVGEGTGLGLATVYGAIKQNNGFIDVQSKSEQGTTFTLYLPRQVGGHQEMLNESEEQATGRGHETILLVEDEPSILEMTTIMLHRLGYFVVAASTPGEAIRLVSEFVGKIDLVLTDVVMPELNGPNLTQQLLTHQPAIKHLFMSGYTANIISNKGIIDEGVSFIQKPFSQKQLALKIRETLERS